MTELILTEEELINLTIEYGYDGSEFNTKAWIKNKSLKNDGTMKKLMSKASTFCDIALLKNQKGEVLKGKKRKYVITNQKEVATKRQFNYGNQIELEEENEIIKEYFMNSLINNDKEPQTTARWAASMGINFSLIGRYIEIDKLFKGMYSNRERQNVFDSLENRFKDRNKESAELAIRQLEKEKRIKTDWIYYSIKSNGEFFQIDENLYEFYVNQIRNQCHLQDINYSIYIRAKKNQHLMNEEMKDKIDCIDKYLLDVYDLQRVFLATSILVVDNNIKQEITREQLTNAYFSKMLKLQNSIVDKDNKATKTITGYVEKEFKSYNLLLVLYALFRIKEALIPLEKVKPTKEDIEFVQKIKRDYAREKARQEYEENKAF